MTREEALNLAIDGHRCRYADELVDKIFNDHEAQLEAKDEKIEELHSRLETIDADYSAMAYDYESAVMEIKKLKEELSRRQDLLNMTTDVYNKFAKIVRNNDTGIPTYRVEK